MPEVEKRIYPYLVEMVCPKCGEGKMEPFGDSVLLTNPPKYPHECGACGHEENYTEKYPKIIYKRHEKN